MRRHPALLIATLFLALFALPPPPAIPASAQMQAREAQSAALLTSTASPSLAPMLARISPSVVNVSAQGTGEMALDALLDFFGMPDDSSDPKQRFQSAGSGVIYDAKLGYVLTNHHVVKDAEKIVITLTDGRQLKATVVAADSQTDIAILKVDAKKLTSLPLGSSKKLQVGDYVVAIGNPFGVGQTATFGIVSALGRTGLGIDGVEDFIQTDASINPGNSGGALVNLAGELIGMNAAILSRGGGNVGIGFAVPVDMIKDVATQLIAQGKVSRGALGVVIQDLTPAIAQAMDLDMTGGALVALVLPQSSAAKAGIADGDVIISIDGQPVISHSQLRNIVAQKRPGTQIQLTLLRDGKEHTLAIILDAQAEARSATGAGAPSAKFLPSGLTLGPIPKQNPNFAKLKGVYVAQVETGSTADEAGIKPDDIIISVGRTAVGAPGELEQILARQQVGEPLLLHIRRGNSALYVAIG